MLRFILGILFGLVAVMFIIQNTEVTDVQFLAWSVSLPRAFMYLILLIIGLALGWIIRSIGSRRKRKNK
jgi:uncharacterized integral membrane protein